MFSSLNPESGVPTVPDLPVFRLPLILASGSPRRIELMREAGFHFEVASAGLNDERWPDGLQGAEIPLFLAELKARAYLERHSLAGPTVLITADTIVWREGRVFGKPKDRDDAIDMLRTLSGVEHQVFTGVCLSSNTKRRTFCVESRVRFARLTDEEINLYVDKYKPLDKAGSYGIQEWIGLIGIERIEGSYPNIVGLPVQEVYENLKGFGSISETP